MAYRVGQPRSNKLARAIRRFGGAPGARVVITTNSKSDESGKWEPCPPGELGRIAHRLEGRRRRRRLTQVAAGCAVLAAVVYWQVAGRDIPGPEGFRYGGITCVEVHRVAPAVKAGTVDAATLERFRKHVELCPHCKSFAKLLPGGQHAAHRRCTDPNCPHHARIYASANHPSM